MKPKIKLTLEIFGLILALLTFLAMIGFFNSAKIVVFRQFNSDYTCQSYPSMSDSSIADKFEITFKNEGNADTSLCVSLSSPNQEVVFKKKIECSSISPDDKITYKLKINPDSYLELDNLTINYNYIYKKNKFKTENHTTSCYYNKTGFSSLQLSSEKLLF